MRISTEKYIFLLTIQLTFLLLDLLFNAFSDSFRSKNINLLIIYILQIIFQIMMFITLLISLFQTNVFQAGFVILIYDRFKATIVVCLIYLVLTIGLHAWVLYLRWLEPTAYIWTNNTLLALFVTHRMTSCLYYYLYKKSALRISDPRFYEDEWINNQIRR